MIDTIYTTERFVLSVDHFYQKMHKKEIVITYVKLYLNIQFLRLLLDVYRFDTL